LADDDGEYGFRLLYYSASYFSYIQYKVAFPILEESSLWRLEVKRFSVKDIFAVNPQQRKTYNM
jgi:hypothetical protein